MRYVERMKREIEKDEPPKPTTAASRKRTVEVLALEAGLPLPTWDRVPRDKPEPIDDTPWRAAQQATVRAQHERLGRHGMALARDGMIRCVKCKDVVLALMQGRPRAIGAPISALALMHRAECKG
jgi:hypothetical protein